MRATVAVAVACLSLASITSASDVQAAIRQPTNIAAQGLAPALQRLAKDRNVQFVYRSDLVKDQHTGGATGDLTFEEALNHLLAGTGLTYKYLENNAITIVPLGLAKSDKDSPVPADSENGRSSEEGTESKSFWDRFRMAQVAQVDQGQTVGTSPVTSERTTELQEVVITSQYKFLSVDTSGTTNLPLPIEKVPQSISLISQDFVQAADLKTLAEIAEYTPGAINAGNAENSGTAIMIRGFTPYRAVDGVNFIKQNGTEYEPDYAIFDRLEIVKGPSSVVYGVSSPGGVVNLVTKSATPQTVNYLYAQVGMWSNYRFEGQIAGALDPEQHVRAIGLAIYDQGDSFIDQVSHKKWSLYGGLNFDLSDAITAYLHGGYERFIHPEYDGILTEPDGSPAPVPRAFFLGSTNVELTSSVHHAEGGVTWHATDMLELNLKANYELASQEGGQVFTSGLATGGDISLYASTLPVWRDQNDGIGLSSTYHLDGLGWKDSFVTAGALYQQYDYHTISDSPGGAGFATSNIFYGEAALTQAFNSLIAQANNPQSNFPVIQAISAKTITPSIQSVLQLVDHLSVLLGASYTKADINAGLSSAPVQAVNIGGRASYRGALMYELSPGANAYVSYSQSFQPQLLFRADGTILPPLIGEQYEAGVKYKAGRLLLTGALFEIKQKNQGEVSSFNPQTGGIYYSPVGEVTHKGFELQSLGQITREWEINAGYAYLDPKVTSDVDPAIVGQREIFLPKQTFSLFTTYTLADSVLRGLSFGAGVRYVSSERTSYDGSTKDMPGYSVVDATLGYTVDRWRVQLNGHNILDRHYFINSYQTLFYGNVVGDPANVSLSIRWQF